MNEYKSITDMEQLINKRIDQKMGQFTEDILKEHEKTRDVVEDAVITMKRMEAHKVHIIILYILDVALLISYAALMFGG